MSRTKWNAETRKTFLQLAARGYDISKICRVISIARKTYYRWCERYPNFAESVLRAKAQGEVKLADIAWRLALDGDASMIRFLLERRFGWNERHYVEMKDVTPVRNALIGRLAAMSPEERTAVAVEDDEEVLVQ